MELKKWAAEKLFQKSRIAKSRPHRDWVQAAQLVKKAYRLCGNAREQFRKFLHYACLFDCHDKERKIGTRSGHAGPPFSVRPEKEAKGAVRGGGRGGYSPTACFSCFVLFASSKENEVASAKPCSQILWALPRPPASAQRCIASVNRGNNGFEGAAEASAGVGPADC